MRNIVILCVLIAFCFEASGQRHKNKETDNQSVKDSVALGNVPVPQDTVYMRMYHNGLKYGDYRLSIAALHGMYALHPKNIAYLDTLCLLYAQTENYTQCILTGREVLKVLPDNIPVISVMAIAEQQVGRYQESLDLFQREYAKNSSLYAGYQIAVLQFSLKKYGEAQASLDRLIINPQALKDKMSFAASSNSSQQVIYKAAAHNLMGIIYQELKDYDKANENFKKALAIQPDFVLAQNNIENLKKTIATEKQENSSNKNTQNTPKNKKTK
jgi:tetratricopeptide (TPR) repeat protein